MKKIPD